jgi:hypothetical protein
VFRRFAEEQREEQRARIEAALKLLVGVGALAFIVVVSMVLHSQDSGERHRSNQYAGINEDAPPVSSPRQTLSSPEAPQREEELARTEWNPSFARKEVTKYDHMLSHIPERRQREAFKQICTLWASLEKTPEYKRASEVDKSYMEDDVVKRWAASQADIDYVEAAVIFSKGDMLNWDGRQLLAWSAFQERE